MMKNFFHISALILLYLLFTAKSCDDREQADKIHEQVGIAKTRDSIISVFSPDSLSMASLRAFETAAMIRLSDFNDYLAILGDTSIDKSFRDEARKMIKNLFISENSVLELKDPDDPGRREVPVRQLMAGSGASAMFGAIIPDSTGVKQSLQRTGDSIYTGTLSYVYVPAGKHTVKHQNRMLGTGITGFVVTKHEKKFGAETLMVWDVFLGNAE